MLNTVEEYLAALRTELAGSDKATVQDAAADAEEKFIGDFVKAWNKVMNLDRFDLL